MASIYPVKGGFRAQVCVKTLRDSGTFVTKREASAWAKMREQELADLLTKAPADRHTVKDMLERYHKEISPSKKGKRAEQLRIESFIRDFEDLAAMKLSEFKTPDLATWRDKRLSQVSNASVSREINLIRNAFSIARKEWHWLDHDPFSGLRRPAIAPPRTRRVDPWSEVKPLVRWLGYRTGHAPVTKQQEVALAFLVALRSGMRAGEILSLGKSNLNLAKRVAKVNHKTQHLTGKPREVPLTRAAARLLSVVADREKCFTVTSASLDALFRKAKSALLIKDLHFHDSRAEALTRLALKVNVMVLAKISGHKNLSILQNTYYRETTEDIAARI